MFTSSGVEQIDLCPGLTDPQPLFFAQYCGLVKSVTFGFGFGGWRRMQKKKKLVLLNFLVSQTSPQM